MARSCPKIFLRMTRIVRQRHTTKEHSRRQRVLYIYCGCLLGFEVKILEVAGIFI